MKKIVGLILVLLIAFTAVGALAEPCEHETYQVIQSEGYVYTSIDDTQHRAEYVRTCANICSKCGIQVGDTYREVDENCSRTEDHSYRNEDWTPSDTCIDCGHQCGHSVYEFKYEFDWSTGPVESVYTEIPDDNVHHTRTTTGPCTVTKVCSGCGKTISTEQKDSDTEICSESHDYDDQGECTSCGHDNTCLHSNSYEDSWITGDSQFVEIEGDNEYHNRVGRGAKQTYCPDCEQTFNYTEIDQVEKKESHSYYNSGTSEYQDTCLDCGHKCTHDFSDHNGQCKYCYMSCNHELHDQDGVCTTCGQSVEHHYENGVCTVCGLPCQHYFYGEDGSPSDTCSRCGYRCTHSNTETRYEFDSSTGQVNSVYTEILGDNINHEEKITGPCTLTVVCSDCGMNVGQPEYREEATETRNSPHNYDKDGKCYSCRHENTCEHTYDENGYCENCQSWCPHKNLYGDEIEVPVDEPRCVQIDKTQHGMATVKEIKKACSTCGSLVYVRTETVEITGEPQPHTFDGNDYCSACSYSCDHEYENGQCKYCYKVCDHSFSSETGICGNCGYQCPHENATGPVETEYVWVSPDQHQYRTVQVLRCEKCNLNRPVRTIVSDPVTEYHVDADDDGICDICNLPLADNFDWHYDPSSSTLTIFGQGSIPNYESGDSTPWADYRQDAKHIVIEENVSEIGDNAFSDFANQDLRVEFLRSTMPTISDTAFSGTMAVCRYYSQNATWPTVNNNLTWIYLPLFSDSYFNNPPALCYDGNWFIYDESNGNSSVYLTAEQAVEYTYSGYRRLNLYAMPDVDADAVMLDGWDVVSEVSFMDEASGSLTINLSADAALNHFDMSVPGLQVTVNDQRESGLNGSLKAPRGTLVYHGNVNELYLNGGVRSDEIGEADVTIDGNVQVLYFYTQDTDNPFKGKLTVTGQIVSGTIYGAQTLDVPGIGEVAFSGMPSQTIAESISQDTPIILNSVLNLTDENMNKLSGSAPKLEDFRYHYQFINGGITFRMYPFAGGHAPDDIEILEVNPNFTLDDIIYRDDTEVIIFEGNNLVFNGATENGTKIGLGNVMMSSACQVVLNCPVDMLNVSHYANSVGDVDLTINDQVRHCTIAVKEGNPATIRLGRNGYVENGEWDRNIQGYRFFADVNGSCDLFSGGRLKVMSWKDGETLRAILPSDSVVAEAAGVDATVEVEQTDESAMTQDEQDAKNHFLATVGGEVDTVFDVSVSTVTEDGQAGDQLTQLGSEIPLTVNNGTGGFGYVLRLHEGDDGSIATDPLCDATAREKLEFGSNLFSKYLVIKAGKEGHVHNLEISAADDTITVTCGNTDGCPMPNNMVTMKILAPEMTTEGEDEKSEEATLDGFEDYNAATNSAVAAAEILYAGRDETEYAESNVAPTTAGKYTAKITVTVAEQEYTAQVDYEIKKNIPDYTVPTGLTATYGQTLADVALPDDDPVGTWSWADNTLNVGNAGTNTFKAILDPADDSFDNVTDIDVAVEVSPKLVTITGLSAEDKVYDGTTAATIAGKAVIDGKVGEDDVTVIPGTAAFDDQNVGEDKTVTFSGYSLKGEATGNYTLFAQPASVTAKITPKSITGATVTLDNEKLEWTGQELTVNVTGVVLADETALTVDDYEVSDNTGTNKGSYTVTVTGKANYKDTATAAWAITEKLMTVTAENVSAPYDGEAHGIALTIKDKASGDAISDAVVKYRTTADGEYTLTDNPTITDVKDSPMTVYYQVTKDGYDTETGSATVTIAPAVIEDPTIEVAVTPMTYDGTAKKPDVTVKNGDAVIDPNQYKVSYSDNTNAGTATVTIAGIENGNYTVSGSTTFTIEPKTVDNPTIELTDKTPIVYDGSEKEPAVTVKDGETPISEEEYTVSYSDNKDAGTATVTITDNEGGNYTVSGSTTFTISQAANPAVVTDSATVVKGGNTVDMSGNVDVKDATGAVTYAITGEANGCMLDGSVLTSGSNEGIVTVTVTVAADTNYLESEEKTITVTVTDKHAQTVSFAETGVSKTYGDAKFINEATSDADGANITYSVTAGDDVVSVVESTGEVTILKVGSATIQATAAETMTHNSASATYTLAVAPKSIEGAVVTLSPTETVYNEAEQDVTVVSVKLGDTDLAATDYTVTGDTMGTNMGTYTVTVTGTGNYQGSATATWRIKGKTMTVSAPNVAVDYDGNAHGISVVASEPAGATVTYGNSADSCTLTASPTITNVSASPKTVYYQVTATNYETVTGSATVTINKVQAVTKSAPTVKTGLVYQGTALELLETEGSSDHGTLNYAVTTEDEAPADSAYSTDQHTATNVGTYYIWYKTVGDGNHTDSTPDKVQTKISPVDKTALNEAIASAKTYYTSIVDNADYTSIASTLKNAIDAAKSVANNDNVTESSVADAVTVIGTAENDAKAAVEAVKQKKAADEAAAKAVADKINAISSNAGVDDKTVVEAARNAYNGLTDEQKKLISADILNKLTTAESQVQAAEKQAADQTAANDVISKINALSGNAGVGDKAAVEAARAAYNGLTADQQALVGKEVVAKLTTAESQVQAAEQAAEQAAQKQAADQAAANDVISKINALSSNAGVGDKAAVEAARAAYEALTADQKKLIPADVLSKLTTAEAQVEAAVEAEDKKTTDEAAAKKVIDAIKALPENAGVGDKAAVEAARAAYEGLTADQKKLIPSDVLNKLTTAEAQVKAAVEAEDKRTADEVAAKKVTDAIKALSDNAGLGDKDAVAAARAAYEALTADQKALIPADVLARLTTAEAQVRQAEEAAQTIEIGKCEITVKDLTYTGKKIKKPSVTVKYNGTKLKEGTDYKISYDKKTKKIGTYKLTVKGNGKYTGSTKVTFKVIPKGTAFSKLTGGNKQITLKWKSVKNIKGYQIEYSVKKDFTKSKKVKIGKAKTLTKTIKKLAAGTTYYVRIRTYTTVSKKTYYSNWSKVKTVKTKGKKAKNASNEQNLDITMNVGEELNLKSMLSAEESGMTWETSDADIATVSEDGVVRALQPGNVTITATNEDGDELVVAIRIKEAEEIIVMDLDDDGILLQIDEDIAGAEEIGEEIEIELSEE